MKKFAKNILSYSLLAFVFVFLQVSPAFAQLSNNSLSLGFAPTSQFLTLKPGSKYKGELTVWNLAPVTRNFDIIVRGFEQIENYPGTARIHTEEEEARDVFSAAKWITIPYKKIFLVPNQYTKIPFEVNVPKDSASGEFHAMIFLVSQTQTLELGQNSTSASNLGSGPVILIKVGDKLIEKAEIEYFKTEKPFYELPPVTLLTRYINQGNTHITPAGDIIISNFLGQEIDKITFNSNHQSLIRGSAGNYSDEWMHKGIFLVNGKLAIGPMKARLVTTYLSQNPGYAPLSAVTSFWVLPWKHILAIIIIVGIMYRIIYKLVKKNAKDKPKEVTPVFDYPRYA